MKRSSLIAALVAVLFVPNLALADAVPTDASNAASDSASPAVDDSVAAAELGWDQFDDPDFDPAAAPAAPVETEVGVAEVTTPEPSDEEILGSIGTEPVAAETTGSQIQLEAPAQAMPMTSGGVVLGPRGVDDQGRAGRLHTVASGDTLWDLSAAYLGTPWVWPSVWIDNDDIANPHLILPGNKIWITANEMRVVTDAEAESFLTPVADAGMEEAVDSTAMLDDALDMDDSSAVAAFDDSLEDAEPSTLEAFPVSVPNGSGQATASGQRITVVRREAMGFVSAEKYEGSSTIVGSPTERTYLAEGDDVILGLGEGDVEVGDQFSIFTVIDEVRDPKTRRLLGHHVDSLGWVEVKTLTGDTSIGQIRTSYSEITRGARIIQRDPLPTTVEMRSTPEVIEGRIVFLPSEREIMADGGYVYLDRGEMHGVEMGSELEVYDPGSIVRERTRHVDVRTPDQVVARLVVVSVESDTSVAFVLSSKRELQVGDSIRPTVARFAQR